MPIMRDVDGDNDDDDDAEEEQEAVEEAKEDDDDKDCSGRTATTMMDTNSNFGLSRPLLLPTAIRPDSQPVAPILVYSSNLSNQCHSQCLKASEI